MIQPLQKHFSCTIQEISRFVLFKVFFLLLLASQAAFSQVVTGVKSGASTIDIAVSSPETGTLYYVLYSATPASPTAASVKTDATAAVTGTIVRNGVVTVTATELSSPLSKVITNLTENKTYYLYTVFENTAGTLSAVQNFTQILPLRQPALSYVATSASISGKTINYLLYKPEPYYKNPTKSYPLLLFFHGDGEKAPAAIDAVKRNGPPKVISDGVELDFIVASPQSQGVGIVDWLSPGFLDEFLEKMKTNNRVDINKVYVTAISGGGGGLYYLSATQAAKIAAIMPVSGVNSFWSFGTNQYCNIKDIPLWGFHNLNDGTVTIANLNAVVNGVNACVPGPVVAPLTTIYNASGHDAWTQTFNNPAIYPWLLGKTKPDPLNRQPVVNAGTDVNLTFPANTIILNGNASDPDGTIVTYEWRKMSGPDATIGNTDASSLKVKDLKPGTYIFRLSVTDNKGSVNYDELTIIVAANQPPNVNAGADRVANLPVASINIAGTATDPDGTVASYLWTQTSGPNTATLANQTTNTLTASNLISGTYVFRLTATDDKGLTGYDEISIIVNAQPTTNAGLDQTITLPTNTILLTGSATDSDGTISTYLWTQQSGPNTATLGGATTTTLSASGLIQGVYVFRLTVTDNRGNTNYDDVTVTVNAAPPNNPPVVDAGTNSSITLPSNTTSFIGTATDSDGSIQSVLWTQVSGPNTAILSGQNTLNLSTSSLITGTYVFRLTATDNKGASAFDEVSLVVNPAPPNNLPTVNAGMDRTITLPTNTILLTGSATDSDGTISTYLWTQQSGPAGATVSGTNSTVLSLGNLTTGVYVFRLTVTDNQGGTNFDEMTLTVNPEPINILPVVDAGTNSSITLPISTASFAGTAIDSDGSIQSVLWTQVSGPNTATLSGQNTLNLSVSNLIAGTYTFRLTATDNKSGTGFDEVSLIVNPEPVNILPIATAGADKTVILPTNTATLTGSATDSDGSIQSVLWTQISGPNTATLSGQNTTTLNLNGLIEGTYTFRLTATDNKSGIGFDEINVFVVQPPANQLPVVDAGTNSSITLPSNTTSFIGTATDSDGSIQSVLWTQVSGPNTATLSGQSTTTLNVSGLIEGTYTFRLTATDNNNASASDEVTLLVNPEPVNILPVVDAGTNSSITLPTNTTNFTGTATDSDGSIQSVLWTQVSGPNTATLSGQNTLNLSVSNLIAGTYVFRLTATDNKSGTGFDEVSLIVNPEPVNIPPVVTTSSDQNITLPISTANFAGTATDSDGSIQSVLWTQVSGPNTATLSGQNTLNLSVSNLIAGTYVFRLTATDNKGGTGFNNVTLTVNPAPPNNPPVVDAGTNSSITLPTNTTSFTGTATDSDGSIQSVLWTQVSGPNTATLSGQNTLNLSVSNLIAGTYTFRLTATDNNNASASDEVTLLVNPEPVNISPVVSAGANQTVQIPLASLTLTGTASDPDGSISSYLWTKQSGPTATLSNTTTSSLTITDLQAGIYIFRLTVTDNKGATSFADVTITVNGSNTNNIPIANAGKDTTIVLPLQEIVLKGSGSDSDGHIVSYVWTNETALPVTLINPTSAILTVTDLRPGIYTFKLTVTDDKGSTSSSFVQITVLNSATASELRAKKIFSPNSDQIEDFWEIEQISNVPFAKILIFNERGRIIHTAQAPTSDVVWDGKANGADVPEGAYYFVVKSNEKDIMAGSFILIR